MPLINIPLKEIECASGIPIRGIIHIGASVGEENEEYTAYGVSKVVWVEPLKESFAALKKLTLQGDLIFNYAISNKDGEGEIFVANNNVSSSLRDLGTHKIMSPDVVMSRSEKVTLRRLDTLIDENKLDMNLYNMLVVDTQGTEDLVLEGCEKYLSAFDVLFLEMNINEVYQGCVARDTLVKTLENRGYKCVLTRTVNKLQTEDVFVKIPKKTFFIIQGHTKYCNELLHSYRNVKNVVWCTDADSPKEDLKKIAGSGMVLKTIPALPYTFGNINRHINSSLEGIKEAYNRGAEYVIKIRSDIVISNYERFLNNMQLDGRVYSTMYVNHNDTIKPNPIMRNNTTHWLNMNFQGLVDDICNYNYLTDWMFYGPVSKLLLMYEKCNMADIAVEEIMCEMRVLASYLVNQGKRINMSFDYLKQEFGIIMGQMNRLGIDLYSLKMQMNYSKMHLKTSFGAIPNVYIPD